MVRNRRIVFLFVLIVRFSLFQSIEQVASSIEVNPFFDKVRSSALVLPYIYIQYMSHLDKANFLLHQAFPEDHSIQTKVLGLLVCFSVFAVIFDGRYFSIIRMVPR